MRGQGRIRRGTHDHERLARRVRRSEQWKALGLGLRMFRRSLDTVMPLAVALTATALTFCLGLVFLAPPALRLTQCMARRERRALAEEFGIEVAEAYQPEPTVEALPDGRYRFGRRVRRTMPGQWELDFQRFTTDPAIWRDLRWLSSALVLGAMAAVPAALIGYGLIGQLVPLIAWWAHHPGQGDSTVYTWFLARPDGQLAWPAHVLLGAAFFGGLGVAPAFVQTAGHWSAKLLSPPENARLQQRVRRLTETRADALDAQAAELRRIERDLHDGVQARLVAMGLNLGAVEQLLERDPAAAKALLAQSREASASALRELRGLVRGIHPPVLAERGLADAIKALALDSPLAVEVAEDLPGRAEPPVESAVYFAVSELLTNAARHAAAERVWIDVHHTGDALRVQVTDDGRGGADASRGSGLRGIERRLATFDGVLALSSPNGGPTIVTLELPCALSSPRTSTSSGKG
ncbi:sensor histidine kinase [Streptantibioticus rubrisoli]|uniref:histidine kinase n=1 Tax=Streptantibioticus rubrisoli TaxID=1387313 RepID=A0ABT1PMJ3_9ACTN|nr:sensor histidine kinase [Streptantibioticus rubrisoli]MCQ4046577.1 sensor histidine kinase [Streptantibioticus rubrisoli]